MVSTYVLFNHTWDLYSFGAGVVMMTLITVAMFYFKKKRPRTNFLALRTEIKKGHDALINANKELIIGSESFHNLNEVLNEVDKS